MTHSTETNLGEHAPSPMSGRVGKGRWQWYGLFVGPILFCPLVLGVTAWQRLPDLDRLMALANLDAAVHYFHPEVATRPSAWDSAFAATAIRITESRTTAEYARALDELLGALHDPATRRIRAPMRWTSTWSPDSVLVIRPAAAVFDALRLGNARYARAVVIDLRGGGPGFAGISRFKLALWATLIVAIALALVLAFASLFVIAAAVTACAAVVAIAVGWVKRLLR